MGCYLCDIDGTVADLSHRLHYVKTKPKNYAAFNASVYSDEPIWPIINVIKSLSKENKIIFCSGREEILRPVTVKWLQEVAGLVPPDHYESLYMRPLKDYRKDDIIKEELLAQIRQDGFNPELVFDDRPSVCRMWRRNGLKVCQLNETEF